MSEMDERFRDLADFMEWVDPEGYAEVLADSADGTLSPAGRARLAAQPTTTEAS